MISNPAYGWCDFKVEDFEGKPSYIEDVPMELLECFISYYNTGKGIAFFDEEGSTFSFILNQEGAYVIADRDECTAYRFECHSIDELAMELVIDLTKDFDEWVDWSYVEDEGDREPRRQDMYKHIEFLKNRLRRSHGVMSGEADTPGDLVFPLRKER